MPTVQRFANCRIVIYADDHFPPHFHLVGAGWRCAINIGSLELMAGAAPRADLSEAVAWARANRGTLVEKWNEYNERD